jgi:hypothetical protein
MHALSLRVYREILLINPPPRNACEQINTLPHQKSFKEGLNFIYAAIETLFVSIIGLSAGTQRFNSRQTKIDG